jgi:tRNA nucleotidyltransferase (CCA-adding enzyme)
MSTCWQHFPHQADIGIVGIAPQLAGAFEQAALGLTAVICEPRRVQQHTAVDVICAAPDMELLLADWLNALIYEMATRHMLFSRYEVHLEGTQLRARAWGEGVDMARHQPAVEVKGATYTELRVFQDAQGLWHAQCVVDV